MTRKILIIEPGISGLTLVERFALEGSWVTLVEKRQYIGGNCYDYFNNDGILVHKYGPHILRTNYDDVWKY